MFFRLALYGITVFCLTAACLMNTALAQHYYLQKYTVNDGLADGLALVLGVAVGSGTEAVSPTAPPLPCCCVEAPAPLQLDEKSPPGGVMQGVGAAPVSWLPPAAQAVAASISMKP